MRCQPDRAYRADLTPSATSVFPSGTRSVVVNANDGRIAKISVAKTGGDLQEFAPNAPDAGPAPPAGAFDVVLEMEAGGNVGGRYHLFVSCYDLTAGASSAAMAPPVGP